MHGVQATGGFGTFYADAITAAQTTLNWSGRAGVQKVIIFLSDGDANAKTPYIASSEASIDATKPSPQRRTRPKPTLGSSRPLMGSVGLSNAKSGASCTTDASTQFRPARLCRPSPLLRRCSFPTL